MKRKELLTLIGSLCLILALVAIPFTACAPEEVTPEPTPEPTPTPEVIRYKMGATSSASSHFAAATAAASLINKYCPDIEVSVMESGATHDNLVKMQQGYMDWGWIVTFDGSCMAWQGTTRDEYIKYGPYQELRIAPGYVSNATYTVIVDEGQYTGINKLEDLTGVRFSAGMKGSAVEMNSFTIFEALGIKPDWVPGGYGDIVTATKDLELAGFSKAAANVQLDASMLDVKAVRKIKLMNWTDEQLDVALRAVPGIFRVDVKQGEIIAMPEQPDLSTWGFAVGPVFTTDISQDVGYRMVKAYYDHWDEFCEAFPAGKSWTPIEDDLLIWGQISDITDTPPFHAGVVQYFEENGYKVPAKLTPSEYKK